jgi:hypothetical protein
MPDLCLVKRYSGVAPALILALLFFFPGAIISTASAADAYYEGYLGDVVDLHGVSYVGNQVYLFLTGPGLPANGVTLNDLSQRADQGYFTIVGLDSNQEWSLKWDTQRLKSQMDPGTYSIYVTTDPVDLAHLGGTSTYKTLEVYLQDTNAPQGENGPGTYTLNPEKHTSSALPTLVTGTRNVTAVPTLGTLSTPLLTEIPSTIVPVNTSAPAPTQAGLSPSLPVVALAGMLCLLLIRRH